MTVIFFGCEIMCDFYFLLSAFFMFSKMFTVNMCYIYNK